MFDWFEKKGIPLDPRKFKFSPNPAASSEQSECSETKSDEKFNMKSSQKGLSRKSALKEPEDPGKNQSTTSAQALSKSVKSKIDEKEKTQNGAPETKEEKQKKTSQSKEKKMNTTPQGKEKRQNENSQSKEMEETTGDKLPPGFKRVRVQRTSGDKRFDYYIYK